MSEKNYDAAHENELGKWRRRQEKAEDAFDHAVKSLTRALSDNLKNPETHRAVAVDMKNATENRHKGDTERSGFKAVDEDEVITGLERLPWDD